MWVKGTALPWFPGPLVLKENLENGALLELLPGKLVRISLLHYLFWISFTFSYHFNRSWWFSWWYDPKVHFCGNFSGWGCYMCPFTVIRGQGAPRDSQVDHLFPQVLLRPPGITTAWPSAKIVTPLLACVAQDTRKPKDFDGGYGLQFNKLPEEDVVWGSFYGQGREGVPRISICYHKNQ